MTANGWEKETARRCLAFSFFGFFVLESLYPLFMLRLVNL